MARADTTSTRLPRGAGTVTKAFFAALDSVPDAMQAAVGKAAQGAIRDELKRRQEKQRNAVRAAKMTSLPPERALRAPARGRPARAAAQLSSSEQKRRKAPAGRGRSKRRPADDGDLV